MFFQIWHSLFHYLTKKLFCVAPPATELNYPFNPFCDSHSTFCGLALNNIFDSEP